MANRYAVGAAGASLLATSSWSTTSGGAPGASVPGTSDVGIFDANSASSYVIDNGDVTAWGQINTSAWTGTISFGNSSSKLTIRSNANISATTLLTGDGIFECGYSSTTGTWTFNDVAFDCNFLVTGTGAKTLSGAGFTVNKTMTWTGVSNFVGAGFTVIVKGGWVGTSYFKDAANNPIVKITGGFVTGTLPNSQNGCILEPSVSDIVFDNTAPTTYKTSVRATTYLKAVSSTYDIITDDNVTYFIAFTGQLETGTAMEWNWCHFASTGTHTLLDDFYCKFWYINKAVVTSNGYTYYVKNGFLHRETCGVKGTSKFVITDTAAVFRNISYSGAGLEGNLTMECDLEINAPDKTVTFYSGFSGSSQIILSRITLKHTAGNCVGEPTLYSGASTIDVNKNIDIGTLNVITIPNYSTTTLPTAAEITTVNIETGAVLTCFDGTVIGTLRQNGTGTYQTLNGHTTNITTSIFHNGTDTTSPKVFPSQILLPEFLTGDNVVSMDQASSSASLRRVSFPSTGDLYTFTLAYDYIYVGETANVIFQGNAGGYIWIPTGYSSFYFFMKPGTSDAYAVNIPYGIGQHTRGRVVWVKTAGVKMKCYMNGVEMSVYTTGNATTLLNGYIDFKGMNKEPLGDIIITSDAKDTAWIAADYAKFIAGGNSTLNQYDNTEPNLLIGLRPETWTNSLTNMKLKYDGTKDNAMIFRGDFRYVDASLSSNPLFTYYGDVTSCDNIFLKTYDSFARPSGMVEV